MNRRIRIASSYSLHQVVDIHKQVQNATGDWRTSQAQVSLDVPDRLLSLSLSARPVHFLVTHEIDEDKVCRHVAHIVQKVKVGDSIGVLVERSTDTVCVCLGPGASSGMPFLSSVENLALQHLSL